MGFLLSLKLLLKVKPPNAFLLWPQKFLRISRQHQSPDLILGEACSCSTYEYPLHASPLLLPVLLAMGGETMWFLHFSDKELSVRKLAPPMDHVTGQQQGHSGDTGVVVILSKIPNNWSQRKLEDFASKTNTFTSLNVVGIKKMRSWTWLLQVH